MSGVVGCEHYTLAYQVRQHHSHQDKYTTCACPPFLSPSFSLSLSLSLCLGIPGGAFPRCGGANIEDGGKLSRPLQAALPQVRVAVQQ